MKLIETFVDTETKWESVFLITLVTAIIPLYQILPITKHKTKPLFFVRDFFLFYEVQA